MADRFEDLRTFTTIVAAGGINAAAAELGIAKSAVSRRLSDLEKRLGVALVERSSRRLETTALGAEYARRARTILASLDELDASPGSGVGRRDVTIRASAAVIRHVLTPAIAATRTLRDPGVLLRLDSGRSQEFDVLIGVADENGSGHKLFSTHLAICASPDYLREHGHPSEARALDAHAAIVIGDAPAEWLLRQRRRAASKVALVTSDPDAAVAAVIAGLGVCQLPDYVAAEAVADGRLVHLLPDEAPRPSRIDAYVTGQACSDAGWIIDALAEAIAVGPFGSISATAAASGEEDGN